MAKRVRPAAHWQSKTDPVRRIADAARPGLRADIKAALKLMPDVIPANASHYAASADWWGLIQHIDWTHFRGVLKGVFTAIADVRKAGGDLGATQITDMHRRRNRAIRFRKGFVAKDAGDEFRFDMYDEELQAELRQAQDDLIQQLGKGARDTIEQVVLSGTQDGLSPDDIVDDIRAVIGLTPRQAQAVMNYRDMLESLDQDALDRRLRNYLEDDVVQAAIDSGEPLSDAMVNKLVQDYGENFLDYRAEMIARTESTRAANAGLQDAYQQAIDSGVFPADAVRQFWRIALDEVTCAICKSIPDMNPDGVAIGDQFASIDGPQEAPPDPHPSCRCSVEIITDLDQVDTGDAAA